MTDEETLYARYLSGELSPEEIKQLDQNGDREKLEKIIAMTDRFRLPEVDKSSGFKKLIAEKKNPPAKVIKMSSTFRWISGIAAALLVALGIYHFTGDTLVELHTTYATTVHHDLPAGSIMMLNAGSQASYDQANWDNSRTIRLHGEAFFDVKQGARFEVITDLGTVQVLGTEFNVRTQGNILSVECYEGKVLITADTLQRIISAQQGIQIRNTTQMDEYTLDQVIPGWRKGRSIFRNAPIQEVLQELERQFDITVSSDITDMNFRGSFDNKNLEYAVNEIAQPLGIKATISPDGKKVTFRK